MRLFDDVFRAPAKGLARAAAVAAIAIAGMTAAVSPADAGGKVVFANASPLGMRVRSSPKEASRRHRLRLSTAQ